MSSRDAHHDHRTRDHWHRHGNFDRAFAIGIAPNLCFVVVEPGFGCWVNSLALLADAMHNLSNVAGLVLAQGGALAGRRRPDARHTCGWRRACILSAFLNALLLVAIGSLGSGAAQRLRAPEPTNGLLMMAVAAIGIVVNDVTAGPFAAGRRDDLNSRGAFLHTSAGVW